MKRDMERRAEGIMPSPSAHKEVKKPKTSEYTYFKKLKPFNNQDHPCLGSSKMKQKHEALVLEASDIKNDKVTEDLVTTKISIQSRTCVSPFLDRQFLEIQAKKKKNVDSDGKIPCLVDGKWCLVATSSSHCGVDRVSDSTSNRFHSGMMILLEEKMHKFKFVYYEDINKTCLTDFRKVHDYEKVFHRKRKKLQDLASRALSVERRDLSLHRSKSLLTLLQRLEVPNNGNLIATLHDNDLENSQKCTSFGIEKSSMQLNFQPKTSMLLDMKSDFQKGCAPFEISSDIERLGHTHHGNNLLKVKTSKFDPEDYLSLVSLTSDEVPEYIINRDSYKCGLHWLADSDIGIHSLCSKRQLTSRNDINLENICDTRSLHHPHSLLCRICSIDYDDTWSSEDIALFSGNDKLLKSKTSNFQYEDHFSLISPWGADRNHHYVSDNDEYHLHGLSDVDFGTHSLCTNQQLAHGIDFDHDKILDTKFCQNPYSLFSRMCFIDYYHKQRVEDFSLFLDIQQPKGCYSFDMFPVERDELSLMQWYDINYKDDGFSSLKGITMQLPDHVNGFSCYRQDMCPEMGKASWTSPEKTMCFNLLLNHEDKQKHYELKHIPENNLVLWDSSNEDILKSDNEDTAHNFSLVSSLWDDDTDYASPILKSSLSPIQLQLKNRSDRWDLKESLRFLYGEETPSQEHHKVLNITDGVHMSERHNFTQVQCAGVAALDNFPSQNKKNTRFPMKLNLQPQNDLNIPDISLTMEEEQECLSASIHPVEAAAMEVLNCDHDSYEEHAGLTRCIDFSLRSKWQTSEKWPKEFSYSNGTNCLVTDSRKCHSCEICHGYRPSYRFNSFQCED